MRDLIRAGLMKVKWTGTENMIADGLTKGLGRNKFDCFVRKLGLCENGDSRFRGSEEVNLDHEWTLVEGRKNRKKSLRKT